MVLQAVMLPEHPSASNFRVIDPTGGNFLLGTIAIVLRFRTKINLQLFLNGSLNSSRVETARKPRRLGEGYIGAAFPKSDVG